MALDFEGVVIPELIMLEDTIIYSLIERAQYKSNPQIYEEGKSGFPDDERSALIIRLNDLEKVESRWGRFRNPEERPFFENLPAPERKKKLRKDIKELQISDFNKVNLTSDILKSYIDIIPRICEKGVGEHEGSSVEHDVLALQNLAQRIHYGAFYVAESKYQSDPIGYSKLIIKDDKAGIEKKLIRKEQEMKILKRVSDKARDIQKNVDENIRNKIDPDFFVDFYEKVVIPITIKGEIQYLLNRTNLKLGEVLIKKEKYLVEINKTIQHTGFGVEKTSSVLNGKKKCGYLGQTGPLFSFDDKGKELQLNLSDIERIRTI